MNKQMKTGKKDAIVALAHKAGKTPEGLIEQALRDVLAKASVVTFSALASSAESPRAEKRAVHIRSISSRRYSATA